MDSTGKPKMEIPVDYAPKSIISGSAIAYLSEVIGRRAGTLKNNVQVTRFLGEGALRQLQKRKSRRLRW